MLIFLNLTACGFSKGLDESKAMVDLFHQLANAKDHQAVYNMGNVAFKEAVTFNQLDDLLKLRFKNLGKSTSSSRAGYNFKTGLSGKTILVSYTTEFQLGTANETFGFAVDDDQYYLQKYNFKVTNVNQKAKNTVTA